MGDFFLARITMQDAYAYEEYGNHADVLKKVSIPIPTIGENEVLIKISASAINPVDLKSWKDTSEHGHKIFQLYLDGMFQELLNKATAVILILAMKFLLIQDQHGIYLMHTLNVVLNQLEH